MFTKILVCLDGSKLAEQTLPYVTGEALRFASKVVLLQVIPEPVLARPEMPGTTPPPVSPDDMLMTAERAASEAKSYLDRIAGLMRQNGVQAESATTTGRPGEAIVDYADKHDVGLVAIASHGRSGLGRAVFGSVAEFVLRESGIPILLIKPEDVPPGLSLEPHPIERLLVCLDGSELAEQILPFAEALATRLGSVIVLLRVATLSGIALAGTGAAAATSPAAGQLIADHLKIAAEEAGLYLRRVGDAVRAKHLSVQTVVLQGDPAGNAIADYAEQSMTDLICMATHGYGGLGRVVFGSVADYVLRQTKLPMLVVKPLAKQEASGWSSAQETHLP